MSQANHIQALVLLITYLPTLVYGSNFAWLPGRKHGAGTPKSGGELVTRMVNALSNVEYAGHERALEVLNSFESLPSCNRKAWSELITTCADLETIYDDHGNIRSTEAQLEEIQSTYATRLAVCELSTAIGPEVLPPACESVFTSDFTKPFEDNGKRHAQTHHFFSSDSLLHFQHKACLAAIFEDTRSWTSYSNALQNTRTICEVSRKHVEKEEALRFHRSMLDVAKQGSQIHTKTVNDMQKLSDKVKKLIKQLEDSIEYQKGQVARAAEDADLALAPLLTQARRADQYMRAWDERIDDVAKKLATRSMQQDELYETVITNQAEYTKQVEMYHDAITQAFAALKVETGTYQERISVLDDSVKALLPEIAKGFKWWEKHQFIMQHSLRKTNEINNMVNLATDNLQAFVVAEEKVFNKSLTAADKLLAKLEGGVDSIRSLTSLTSWAIRAFWTAYHQLPAPVIAVGYFLFFMAVAMVLTAAGRKLSTIPFRAITAPIYAISAYTINAPWPVPVIMAWLAIFFGILETPAEFVDRWAYFDCLPQDAILLAGIALPVLLYGAIHMHKQAKAAALGLPNGQTLDTYKA